jgi:hypothetical protein
VLVLLGAPQKLARTARPEPLLAQPSCAMQLAVRLRSPSPLHVVQRASVSRRCPSLRAPPPADRLVGPGAQALDQDPDRPVPRPMLHSTPQSRRRSGPPPEVRQSSRVPWPSLRRLPFLEVAAAIQRLAPNEDCMKTGSVNSGPLTASAGWLIPLRHAASAYS